MAFGIVDAATFIPESVESIQSISEQSGIDAEELTEKIGLKQKPVALNISPYEMGLESAKRVLDKTGIDPKEIGFLIYAGGSMYDDGLCFPASRLQHTLGAANAQTFEIRNACNGSHLAIHMLSGMMANTDYPYGLIVCAEKWQPFVDYKDHDSISLFILADGGGSFLVSNKKPQLEFEHYHSCNDPSLSEYVTIRAGGTEKSHSSEEDEKIRVHNRDALNTVLSETYLENYREVISKVMTQSNITNQEIQKIFTNQVKLSLTCDILGSFDKGLADTIVTLPEYGHLGSVDLILGIEMALTNQVLSSGDRFLMASSGLGFTWAASSWATCKQ